eukprot:g4137.t1
MRRRKEGSLKKHAMQSGPAETVADSETGLHAERTCYLLAIIIDDLPFEHIWRRWMAQSAEGVVNVKMLVHAKYPDRVKSPWLRERLIPVCYKPEWGSVEITKAMLALLTEGIRDKSTTATVPTNSVYAFVSESCVPIRPLSTFTDAVWTAGSSWIDVRHKPRNGYNASSQWCPIEDSGIIPREYVCKSDQWVLLTEAHARMVLELPQKIGCTQSEIWKAFQKSCASDEMYFSTLLCCCGLIPGRLELERDGTTSKVQGYESRKLTFVEWNFADLDDYTSGKALADRPTVFKELEVSIIAAAVEKGCMFLRKIDSGADLSRWESLIAE